MMGTGYRTSDEANLATWLEYAAIKSCYSLIPRRCYSTGRLLWFRKAYCTYRMYTGPGDPVYEYRWYDAHEFILLRLKAGV